MQKVCLDYHLILEDVYTPPQHKIIYLERLRAFFSSRLFMLLVFAFFLITYVIEIEVYGLIVSLLLISMIFIFSRDILPTYLPLMLSAMSVLRMYNSYDIFIQYIWALAVAVACLIFYLLANRPAKKRILSLKLLLPQLLLSIALLLGGIGSITFKEYFNLTALYYMLGLGFCMLFAYIMFSRRINPSFLYDSKEKLAFAMFVIGSYSALMIFIQYAVKALPVLLGPPFSYNVITRYFSLSNNTSTVLLMVLPFSFYLAARKKEGVVYFVSGILQGIAMLISTSRSGFIFAFALTLPLTAYTIIKDKAKRSQYIISIFALLGVFMAVFVVGYDKIWSPIFNNYAFNMKKDGKIYLAIAVESIIIITYFALLYKLKGKRYASFITFTILIFLGVIAGAVLFKDKIISYLIRIDKSRGKMAELAVNNFFKYPIFGTGLGYTGTNLYYKPKPMALGFYHSMPFQLLGLGAVGIVAYLYMGISRIRLLRSTDSYFNYTVFFALIGLYLMSFVNPGIFVPFMFMLQINLYFVIVEQNLQKN